MSAGPPPDYPITGLCVVANPEKCPPGYELLYRSYDKRDDCDLWKDSFFKARVTRYLCFTRAWPLDGGRLNNVMVDVVLQNEREIPPAGFTLLEKTVDSGEKATRKKQMCVKMIPRSATTDAINELIILSKSKRPPPGYTMVGEMNGLVLCFKMGNVPPDTSSQSSSSVPERPPPRIPPHQPTTPTGYQPAPSYAPNNYENCSPTPYPLPRQQTQEHQGSSPGNSHLERQESVIVHSGSISPQSDKHDKALSGVPFELNPKYQNLSNLKQISGPEISFRSIVDLNNEYSYPFRLERQVAGGAANHT